MKIIICCNAYPPNFIGGAELIAHFQALELTKKGHEVFVFCGETSGKKKRYVLEKEVYEGLNVNRIHLSPMDYQPEYVNFSHKKVEEHFINLLNNFKPDIVHFHNIIGLSAGIIYLTNKRKIKTFLTLHDKWGFCYKNTGINEEKICENYNSCNKCMPFINEGRESRIPIQMRKDYLSLIFLYVDHFISPSRYLAQQYIKAEFPENKMNVLWNGINIKKFECVPTTKINSGKTRFTYVGYLGRHKGLHLLLDALAQLPNQKNVIINLVGEGDEEQNLKHHIKKSGSEKHFKFWGKIDNNQIEKVYRETDILVLPSIWPENQPVSITEAMACKIPVIATRLGGSVELVDDNKSGFLFEFNNSLDLSHKMGEFISNPSKIKQFGEAGYQKIIHNTFEKQVDKLFELYNKDSVPGKTPEENKQLIVCIGEKVDHECAVAMDRFLKTHKDYYFIMEKWLEDDLLKYTKIFWVVDKNITIEKLNDIFRFNRPVLVPEQSPSLKSLCINKNCGLYYDDPIVAEICLEYLIKNEQAADAMGGNIAYIT